MARPSDEFLWAWSSLSGIDPAAGWHAIALPSAGPIEVRAGRRSPDNAEAILLGFPSVRLTPVEKLPEGQGFAIERVDPEGTGHLRLALTRRTAGSAELFATMACDVVGALDDAAAAGAAEARLLRVFIGRVGAWQEFMRKGAQALSPEAEVGLVGELMLLQTIIDAGVIPAIAVESWVGPLDGIQDFELGAGALEVKATLSATGFLARIGSLEQLDDSTRQPLFLAGVRLRQNDVGVSLPELVARTCEGIKENAGATCLLGERLLSAGYFGAHAERYVRRFTPVNTQLLEVNEEFPRLTHGRVPMGITRATYEIDLDRIAGERMNAVDALKKLGVI